MLYSELLAIVLDVLVFSRLLRSINELARQRGLPIRGSLWVATGIWILLLLLTAGLPNPDDRCFMRLMVGSALVLLVEVGTSSQGLTWQCPACTCFNEDSMVMCECGFQRSSKEQMANKMARRPSLQPWIVRRNEKSADAASL